MQLNGLCIGWDSRNIGTGLPSKALHSSRSKLATLTVLKRIWTCSDAAYPLPSVRLRRLFA
jgi:hypothetical protein